MIYGVVLSFCALALVVAVTGETILGIALLALEFSVVLGMRQMGMAMAPAAWRACSGRRSRPRCWA